MGIFINRQVLQEVLLLKVLFHKIKMKTTVFQISSNTFSKTFKNHQMIGKKILSKNEKITSAFFFSLW